MISRPQLACRRTLQCVKPQQRVCCLPGAVHGQRFRQLLLLLVCARRTVPLLDHARLLITTLASTTAPSRHLRSHCLTWQPPSLPPSHSRGCPPLHRTHDQVSDVQEYSQRARRRVEAKLAGRCACVCIVAITSLPQSERSRSHAAEASDVCDLHMPAVTHSTHH